MVYSVLKLWIDEILMIILYRLECKFIFGPDESPTTCGVFLAEGGLSLFLEVLQTFPGEATVETKVLGLVNNIAEVPVLRTCLLQPTFIGLLR